MRQLLAYDLGGLCLQTRAESEAEMRVFLCYLDKWAGEYAPLWGGGVVVMHAHVCTYEAS